MQDIIKELEKYKGRGTVSSKAEFYHNTALEILKRFETRSFKDIEVFADFLKYYGKTVAEVRFYGVESNMKPDEEFYKELLRV